MKTIFGNENARFARGSTAVGLGNFDVMHVGHMALVNTLISEARINGLDSLIYTFTKHPENIIRKKLFTPLLTTVAKRAQLLGETTLDYLYFDEFDENYSRMKPEDFIRDILLERLGAGIVAAGFNYRFGYMGQGNVELLREFGRKYDFRVTIIPPVRINKMVVSSSAIRSYVAKGDMESAFELLGRHYSLTGEVRDGMKRGRRIGFPTANLQPEDYLILPHNGVYITKTLYNGGFYDSLTSVGYNPTFEDTPTINVETHILDFNDDIYSKNIEVFFLKKLRNEKRFKSARELSDQIVYDIKDAREYFGANRSLKIY